MARGGAKGGAAKGAGRPSRGRTGAKRADVPKRADAAKRSGPATRPRGAAPAAQPADAASLDRVFRLGVMPGATPGTWVQRWRDRMPGVPLELVPIEVREQRAALDTGDLDAALVRLPIDDAGLHVIALYDEIPVVVTAADSALTVAEELTADDLTGEVLIVPADDVLHPVVPGTVAPAFAPPADTAEAIATVAAGVGVVVVPMSLARLHSRKDAAHRPLRDGPTSTVALAWRVDRTTPDVETFVGIVRGRTANSSR